MSGLVFLGCLFSSFGFFRRRRRPLLFCLFLFLFFREIDQVVTGHTPHTHLCSFAFSCLCPRRVCLFTRFGRASFLSGVLSGCHSGPRAFLGFSWYSSEAFFSDARRQGCFRSFLSVVFVFPFCCVSRLFSHQLEGADPSSYVAYPRVVVPAPRPSEGPGSAVERGGLVPSFSGFLTACL